MVIAKQPEASFTRNEESADHAGEKKCYNQAPLDYSPTFDINGDRRRHRRLIHERLGECRLCKGGKRLQSGYSLRFFHI